MLSTDLVKVLDISFNRPHRVRLKISNILSNWISFWISFFYTISIQKVIQILEITMIKPLDIFYPSFIQSALGLIFGSDKDFFVIVAF